MDTEILSQLIERAFWDAQVQLVWVLYQLSSPDEAGDDDEDHKQPDPRSIDAVPAGPAKSPVDTISAGTPGDKGVHETPHE
jgi:hypothetical protein